MSETFRDVVQIYVRRLKRAFTGIQKKSADFKKFKAMVTDMTELLQTAEKFGLGKMYHDRRGYSYLHKFMYESL